MAVMTIGDLQIVKLIGLPTLKKQKLAKQY